MQDAGNPFQDLGADLPQAQDTPFPANLPIDPNTGVPVVTIGRGTSQQPTGGGGTVSLPPGGLQTAIDNQGATTPQATQDNAQSPPPSPGATPSSDDDDAAMRAWATAKAQAKTPKAPAPGEQPYTSDDVDKVERQATASAIAQKTGFGSPLDVGRAINYDALNKAIIPLYRGSMVLSASEAANSAQQQGMPDVQDAMEKLGADYLRDPNKAYVDAGEMFKALGVQAPIDPQTYFGDAGHAVWSTIATAMAMYYGAAKIASDLGIRGVDALGARGAPMIARLGQIMTQKYAQAVQENPGLWIAGEGLGGIGATIGGEYSQNRAVEAGQGRLGSAIAGLSGSIYGGIAGGVAGAWVTGKVGNAVVRISKVAARQILNLVDRIGGTGMFGRVDYSPNPNIVDPDILNNARATEQAARSAGDDVVMARKFLDQNPTGEKNAQGRLMLKAAQDVEAQRVSEAEKAWNMIPLEARQGKTRSGMALRSLYADTSYPRQFAEDQIQGATRSFDQQTAEAFASVTPADRRQGMAVVGAKLYRAMQSLNAQAKGRLAKYWKRADLSRPMPNRSNMLKAMDGIEADFHTNYDPSQYPKGEIDEIRERFAPFSAKPTLEYVRNKANALFELRNRALSEGKGQLARNCLRLYSALMGEVARAFPDDVNLQQARAESEHYFELFKRTDISPFFQINRRGNPVLRPEASFTAMLKKASGLADISKAVQMLVKQGVVSIRDPDFMTKATKEAIASVQDSVEQGIKQSAADYINKVEGDPAKVAKYLGSPEFQEKIKTSARAAADARAASQQLKSISDARTAMEKSALAKYMQADPDQALDNIWNGSNPAAQVKALLDGTPGVGGFRGDPQAEEGLAAGLLDRFAKTAGGKPEAMVQLLKTARGRALEAALGPGEYSRLENIVNRINSLSIKAASNEGKREWKTVVVQMMALKVLHHLSEVPGFDIFLEVGGGGSLQRASLVSGLAKDWMEHSYAATDDWGEMLHKAITNPEYESEMFKEMPITPADMKARAQGLRRMMAFERGIWNYYNQWNAYGEGPAAPGVKPDPDDSPLHWLIPSAGAAPGANLRGVSNTGDLPMRVGPGSPRIGAQGDDQGILQAPPTQRRADDNVRQPHSSPPQPTAQNPGQMRSPVFKKNIGDVVPGPTPNTIQGNLNATGPNAKGLQSMLDQGMKTPPLNVVPHPTLPGRLGLTRISDKGPLAMDPLTQELEQAHSGWTRDEHGNLTRTSEGLGNPGFSATATTTTKIGRDGKPGKEVRQLKYEQKEYQRSDRTGDYKNNNWNSPEGRDLVDQVMGLYKHNESLTEIASHLGMTKGVVAGIIYRNKGK